MLFVGIALVCTFGLLCAYSLMRAAAITDRSSERTGERLEMQREAFLSTDRAYLQTGRDFDWLFPERQDV